MITLSTAEKALKTVYLGVIGNQINMGTNPLLAKIKHTSNNVYGNEIVKSTSYGISGGVSAGGEEDALPKAVNKQYSQFRTTLKNLYGTLEITDKAIRCSQNSAGAFVNLLNEEMESLIKSSSFNMGRMLYGDGTGILGTITTSTEVTDSDFVMDSVKNFAVNQVVRLLNNANTSYHSTYKEPVTILSIDRGNKTISTNYSCLGDIKDLKFASLGFKKEITGLGAIFDTNKNLYGLDRKNNAWLNPYINESVGAISETAMQTAIDEINENSGEEIDFISCSSAVRRYYQDCMSTYKKNIDVMDLQGGFKALSYNGIPVVNDRFVEDDTMYLLSTKNFEMCQLGDWEWLEGEDGKIIKQKEGYPIYTATLVKYAELLCGRPNSQAKLTGITG